VDVVFFHGLQLSDYRDAWWKTWVVAGNDDGPCWPRTLLGADFQGARVLSVCYDSAARRSRDQGRLDLTSLGDLLAGALLLAGVGQRPLVLVGHSLGGLMLQQVCLSVDGLANTCPDAALKRRASAFIGNVVAAVFYSSPLGGSRLADLANYVSWLAGLGPVMKTLTTLSLDAHRVTGPFGDLRKREQQKRPGSWATLGFCETNATSLGKVGGMN
jgi:protein SERAC1